MFHIHNGDSSANTAKESSVPGKHFAFRESLITGPAPAAVSIDEWRSLRARHLSESYGVDREECERGLLDQEQKLASLPEHEEVVLWFEHDLFCQTNLLYLLDWFGRQDLGDTKLSLICIGEFPGKENFRGLGELNAEQMASLFPTRKPVTAGQLQLGQAAWQAYCAPDPVQLEQVIASDTSALPLLGPALRAHLRRFPSTRNGLGQIENRSLELIRSGATTFTELFPRFIEAEPIYGLGDAQLWLALLRLSCGNHALLELENGKADAVGLLPPLVRDARFKLTNTGVSVLRGEADFVGLNGIDLWLGGVHLSFERFWRWNESTGRVGLTAD
ncbi:MAG TPA: hypothetical protein VMS31_19685 [Pyrinomonadaceae bacterium]|nr:hypothetical protein [Pyrinomonadaceae bacterium]